MLTVKARAGYAVGALTVKTALAIDGLSVTFMRVKDGKLNWADAYESEWVGGDPPQRKAVKLDGAGEPAVGLIRRADDRNLIAVGLVFRGQEKALGAVPPLGTRVMQIHGRGLDPEFQDLGPAGSRLVGLEVGVMRYEDRDVVRAFRPIYRRGGKDEPGVRRGTDLRRVVKLSAKPGFAIGAVTLKSAGTVDGLSITFMRVRSGTLDPTDSYESEWADGTGGHGPVRGRPGHAVYHGHGHQHGDG